MRRASVGTTGIELSAIGLGGFELGESAADVPAARSAIAAALESGVNWVDTADEYHATANESVIGEALGGLPEQPLISSKLTRVRRTSGRSGATTWTSTSSSAACSGPARSHAAWR